MSLCAFFGYNLASPHPRFYMGGTHYARLTGNSPADPLAPAHNVVDPRPRKVFSHPATGGGFDIHTGNQWMDIRFQPASGGGVTGALRIPVGFYPSPTALAMYLSVKATNMGQIAGFHAATYVTFSWLDGRFRIQLHGTASDQLQIQWQSGAHGSGGADNNCGGTIGFYTGADSAFLGIATGLYVGNYPRYAGATYLRMRVSGPGLRMDLYSTHLFSTSSDWGITNSASEHVRASFDDVAVFVSSTHDFGNSRAAWVAGVTAGNATRMDFSSRHSAKNSSDGHGMGDVTDNALQVATDPSASAPMARNIFFSWIHEDGMESHEVGTLGVWQKTGSDLHLKGSSETRTVKALTGHGLIDDAKPMTSLNAYPPGGLQRTRMELEFGDWEWEEWNEVVRPIIRNGGAYPIIFSLNWTDLVSGAVTGQDEVAAGYLLYSTLTSSSGGDYSGQSSDYVSGRLVLDQLR